MRLLGRPTPALPCTTPLIPSPLLTPGSLPDGKADRERVAVGVPALLLGVDVVLSTLDSRAADLGVTLPFARAALIGVVFPLTLGVGGSERMFDGVRVAVGLGLVTLLLPATRGVIGVRAFRFDETDGFSGRWTFADRSDDIGVMIPP